MNSSTLWNQAVDNPPTEKVRGKYLTKLFLLPIKRATKYCKESDSIKILKVDLWNEGVDFQRNILKHLDTPEHSLYGMDISSKTCSLAKKNTPHIYIHNGTIEFLAVKNKSFDMILDLSTLDHLPKEKLDGVIKEYNRVLKSDGVFVLVFDWWGIIWYCYMYYLEKVRGHKDYFFKNTSIPSRYIHPISLIKRIIKKNHFEIKEEYCVDYTGWMWNRITKPFWMWLPDKGYDALLSVEYSKLSKYMRPFAKQYVIIAQKIKLDF